MNTPIDRRRFLPRYHQRRAALGLGSLAFLSGLPPISAAEAKTGLRHRPSTAGHGTAGSPPGRDPARANCWRL